MPDLLLNAVQSFLNWIIISQLDSDWGTVLVVKSHVQIEQVYVFYMMVNPWSLVD